MLSGEADAMAYLENDHCTSYTKRLEQKHPIADTIFSFTHKVLRNLFFYIENNLREAALQLYLENAFDTFVCCILNCRDLWPAVDSRDNCTQ